MKKIFLYLFTFVLAITTLIFYANNAKKVTAPEVAEKPLLKYSVENLSPDKISEGIFTIGSEIKNDQDYNSRTFEFLFRPDPDSNQQKKITGQINIPNISDGVDSYPIVLMLRGYVDQKQYQTGDGTRNAASFFAKNGLITIAPDFLGYGGSHTESSNIFESRFQTYVTAISTLRSLSQISKWDKKNIYIWAHSNGGQIALTILSSTEWNYPTALWAPVSKPFPYSVLYFTDESSDGGKFIRKSLSDFESLYDTDLFSFTNYLQKIKAPIRLTQGNRDDAVPKTWSDTFITNAGKLGIDIEYNVCDSCDHNMRPLWDNVVAGDLLFFKKHMLE